jgi:hypothetical protein
VGRTFKRAQSVFTDVIRTALSLEEGERTVDASPLARAGDRIQQVLGAATVPLGIKVPAPESVTAALGRWCEERAESAGVMAGAVVPGGA